MSPEEAIESESLELASQALMRSLMWVLETELESSAGAVLVLNH